MSSSGKTQKLGLSLWEAGDRPQRLDFRQDNERLEALVAPHLTNNDVHLSSSEKQWVKKPYYISSYTGNGSATRKFSHSTPIISPRFMMIFARKDAPQRLRNGELCLYSAYGTTKHGGTPGLVVESKTFTVCQQPESETQDGYRYCLNEKGREYVVVVLP